MFKYDCLLFLTKAAVTIWLWLVASTLVWLVQVLYEAYCGIHYKCHADSADSTAAYARKLTFYRAHCVLDKILALVLGRSYFTNLLLICRREYEFILNMYARVIHVICLCV